MDNSDDNLGDVVLNLFQKNNKTYFTTNRVSKDTNIPEVEVKKYIESNPNLFRKSILKTTEKNLFILNTSFGYLKDVWNYFSYINKQKYC